MLPSEKNFLNNPNIDTRGELVPVMADGIRFTKRMVIQSAMFDSGAASAIDLVPEDVINAIQEGARVYLDAIRGRVGTGAAWAGAFTALTIEDGGDTPRVFATIAKAGLTVDTNIEKDSGIVMNAAWFRGIATQNGEDDSPALKLKADGTVTAGSDIEVVLEYRIERFVRS